MRLVLLNENILGKELAVSIYLSNGIIYANKGTILSKANIILLKNIGIDTVYIKDGNDDVNLRETLKTPIRIEVIHELKHIYDDIYNNNLIKEDKIINIANKIIDNIDASENSFLPNNIGEKKDELKLILHSINVTILSITIGINKKYNKDKLKKLAIGALLHDVGKLFDEGIKHCKIGYDLIKNNSNLPVTSYMCILYHHECEDGTGYPEKVQGDKIHEFAKIVSICNEYVNLCQEKKIVLPSIAIEHITSQVGSKFNKEIYEYFINSIYCYPNGLYVKLNNGVQGVVVLQNEHFPTRPMIGIIENGTPIICNLMKNLTLSIEEVIL